MGLLKKKQFSVCVFCGARKGKNKIYSEVAEELGILIAENNMKLVYGAGGTGLMGKVSMAVLKLKGLIYGVTTKLIADFEEPIKGTKTKIVKNIQGRKREFIDKSDAFISLPGGFGTFDEIFDVLVAKEITEKHNELVGKTEYKFDKPIILINTNGFFDAFIKLIDSIIANGFMNASNKKYFKVVKTPKEAINYLKKEFKIL